MLKKSIFGLLTMLLSFALCKGIYAGPFGPTPPFDMSGGVGNTTYKGPIKKGQWFSFDVSAISWDAPLNDVNIKISLPPEVKKLDGNLSWEGDLNPKSEKDLNVRLSSEKDWKYWSSPIKGYVEFIYKGEKDTREVEWSSKGYKDSCWRGEKFADFANRWCLPSYHR